LNVFLRIVFTNLSFILICYYCCYFCEF